MNAQPTPTQAHLPIEESDQIAVFSDFYCRLATDPLLARHHLCDPEARHELRSHIVQVINTARLWPQRGIVTHEYIDFRLLTYLLLHLPDAQHLP